MTTSTLASPTAVASDSPARTSFDAMGLHLHRTGTRTWRVVHTRSGLHVPMVTWPTDDLPRGAAEVALAVLSNARVDWTRTAGELRADLDRVSGPVRDAGVIARAVARRAAAS